MVARSTFEKTLRLHGLTPWEILKRMYIGQMASGGRCSPLFVEGFIVPSRMGAEQSEVQRGCCPMQIDLSEGQHLWGRAGLKPGGFSPEVCRDP